VPGALAAAPPLVVDVVLLLLHPAAARPITAAKTAPLLQPVPIALSFFV
jgi:hypothetical protein